MNYRNKQQQDIMFNMVFDFAIHGITEGQAFFREVVEVMKKHGDAIRLVGYNTKKPTARVETNTLYSEVFIPFSVLEKLPDNDDTNENGETKKGESSDDSQSN